MKHTRSYIILGVALLLSSGLLVNSGSTAVDDVISFVSEKGGDSPIILMNTQGEIRERLTTDPGQPFNFTWSPDGRSIAYDSPQNGNFDIYVMDVNTNAHRQLTVDGSKDLDPAWSPNGKWIAFVSNRAGGRDIHRMDANGKNVKQLTSKGDYNGPVWSPDSQLIAFTSKPSLFLMDAEGRNLRELTARVSFSGCTWSPDGKQLAFISNADDEGLEVFSIDINGKNLRQLTQLDPLVLIWYPVWSPSGEWIAYIVGQIRAGGGPVNQIMANGVISVVNTIDGAGGKPIEATRGVPKQSLQWVPKQLLSVSPSTEKQATLWGRLKQSENAAK